MQADEGKSNENQGQDPEMAKAPQQLRGWSMAALAAVFRSSACAQPWKRQRDPTERF